MTAAFKLDDVEKIIRNVGAEQIMPRFRKLAEHDVEMKGVNDPVTIADKETERHLTEALTAYLSGSTVVGEETFAKDKSIMARLDAEHPVWIIDPIDGTRNFVAGVPEFATMIALVKNREPIASWIHDPNSGDTIMAEKGAGVWLRGNRLTLATQQPNIKTVGLVGTRVKKLISDPKIMPAANDVGVPEVVIGSCAGFDYPRLFVGGKSFADANSPRANFLLYRHTNAWDHVPGLFLHTEGGGYAADWQGKPYDMADNKAGLLLTSDKDSWERIYHHFQPLIDHVRSKLS